MATDIAFAIEFYLFWESSSYFAQSILTALAVIDDLGAILVIAILYRNYCFYKFVYCLCHYGRLIHSQQTKCTQPFSVLNWGVAMWYFMLNSGFMLQLQRIAAFVIPFGNGGKKTSSYRLQHFLQTCRLLFFLFAIANTCIPINSIGMRD
jgi:NhaA family Na+:H+ antiporter